MSFNLKITSSYFSLYFLLKLVSVWLCLSFCPVTQLQPPLFFTMFRTKNDQMPLIYSLSLHPCFTTTVAEYLQRDWLIHRGTNTTNYSLMSTSESKFSWQPFPTLMYATAPIIAGWIKTAEYYPRSFKSICLLLQYVTQCTRNIKANDLAQRHPWYEMSEHFRTLQMCVFRILWLLLCCVTMLIGEKEAQNCQFLRISRHMRAGAALPV